MTLEDFKDIELEGDIKEENGEFNYFFQTDFYDPDDDNSTVDHLYDVYCEDMKSLLNKFPNAVITDVGADNDSTWFTIKNI